MSPYLDNIFFILLLTLCDIAYYLLQLTVFRKFKTQFVYNYIIQLLHLHSADIQWLVLGKKTKCTVIAAKLVTANINE